MHFRHPRHWLTFRGVMSRRDFWLYYLSFCLALAVSVIALSLVVPPVANLAPALLGLVDLAFSGVLLVLCIGLVGAMVRRMRDSGRHWWSVAVGMLSLMALIVSLVGEGMAYTQYSQAGRLDYWIANRVPLTEAIGLLALVSNFLLYRGLTAKGARPPRKPDPDHSDRDNLPSA